MAICKRRCLEASQLITNYDNFKRKGMFSVNGQSSEYRESSDWSKVNRAMADWPRVDCRMTIVRRWLTKVPTRKSRYAKGRYDGERAKKDAIVDAQKKMRWRTRKKRYGGSLGNCEWGKASRTTDRRRIKRRFGLVVKLIANEYYMDLFCYLSHSFLVALADST